jgi:hypothetical protein
MLFKFGLLKAFTGTRAMFPRKEHDRPRLVLERRSAAAGPYELFRQGHMA